MSTTSKGNRAEGCSYCGRRTHARAACPVALDSRYRKIWKDIRALCEIDTRCMSYGVRLEDAPEAVVISRRLASALPDYSGL